MKKFKRALQMAWTIPFAILMGVAMILMHLFAFLAAGKRGLQIARRGF